VLEHVKRQVETPALERNVGPCPLRSSENANGGDHAARVLLAPRLSLTFGMVNSFSRYQIRTHVLGVDSRPAVAVDGGAAAGFSGAARSREQPRAQRCLGSEVARRGASFFTVPALIFIELLADPASRSPAGCDARHARHPADDPASKTLTVERHGELRSRGDRVRDGLMPATKGGASAPPCSAESPSADLHLLGRGFTLWGDTSSGAFGARQGVDRLRVSPIFLGVGYLIGPRIAGIHVDRWLIGCGGFDSVS